MINSSLGILMPFAVLQVYLPAGKPFQIEFRISDGTNTKRRLIFVHGAKTIIKNQLHARIPSALFKRSIWLNLCINVKEFFEHCFPDCEFKEIDSISINAQCKCRKIFFMNSPIVDTSQLDNESGVIPEVESLEKNCEPIPKANDFKFGVNFMNQMVNITKVDYFLGSTIDDSALAESAAEESIGKKSSIGSAKSKMRIGSGNSQLKHHKGLLKSSKVDDNCDESATFNRNSECENFDPKLKSKNKTRYSSVSPFPQNKTSNSKQDPNEKSTDGEGTKGWGKANKLIDKRNSTKATNNTNSENDENSWIKSNQSKPTKARNNNLAKRGNSMAKAKQSDSKDKKLDLTNTRSSITKNTKVEEDKIIEENEIIDSYSAHFETNEDNSAKKTPVLNKVIGSPINPEIIKKHNKTETILQPRQKSKKHGDPSVESKITTAPNIDSKLKDSNSKIIGFEDSLVSGTKIEMPNKGKQIQKRVNDVNEKRKKINEIEQKYDLNDKNAQKKGASRGYSNQDRERIKNKPKNSSISRKVTANEKQEDISKVELNASKITTQKRDAFKSKKGNEMTSEKIVYKSKRNINDEMIDEKTKDSNF